MNVKECIEMIKRDFTDAEIKKIISGIKIKTPAKPKQVDTSVLVWETIQDNKMRPVLGKCLVHDNSIIGTDLECTVIVPNNENIPNGLYTKQMMKLKTYSDVYKENIDEFPTIKINKYGTKIVYDKSILEQYISEIMFALPDNDEDLAVNGIRFAKEVMSATNTYRLAYKELKSEVEYTLPKKTCKVLLKALKASSVSSVDVYIDSNQAEIFIGDIIIKSRLIDLPYLDVKKFIKDKIITTADIIFNDDLLPIMEKLVEVGKNNTYSKYSFIFDVKNKTMSAVGSDNKVSIDVKFDIKGIVEFDKIGLNSKFILEYLKANKPDEIIFKVYKNDKAVMVNDDYLIMPVDVR